jgi:tetratricopeptide (TPR) repeat protein
MRWIKTETEKPAQRHFIFCIETMLTEPHLFFAEVSLDLSRGEYRSGLKKLQPLVESYPDSYLVNLLFARALKGIRNYSAALGYLEKCCQLAPANQVAWKEAISLQALAMKEKEDLPATGFDPVADELEQLSAALQEFQPILASESFDPTPINKQKQPFPDDMPISVPTETLAKLFARQGAYKKAIRIYTSLIQLKPEHADHYRNMIDELLEKL